MLTQNFRNFLRPKRSTYTNSYEKKYSGTKNRGVPKIREMSCFLRKFDCSPKGDQKGILVPLEALKNCSDSDQARTADLGVGIVENTNLISSLTEVDECEFEESSEHEEQTSPQIEIDRCVHKIGGQRSDAARSQGHHGQDACDTYRRTGRYGSPKTIKIFSCTLCNRLNFLIEKRSFKKQNISKPTVKSNLMPVLFLGKRKIVIFKFC